MEEQLKKQILELNKQINLSDDNRQQDYLCEQMYKLLEKAKKESVKTDSIPYEDYSVKSSGFLIEQ